MNVINRARHHEKRCRVLVGIGGIWEQIFVGSGDSFVSQRLVYFIERDDMTYTPT